MADEKSLVKMNKMIHKKTWASFLVVYVIYVCLRMPSVYRWQENCVMFTPPTYHLCNFWKAIKMSTCMHTGRYISVPLCSGQSELASICLFVQFNNQLDIHNFAE